MGVFSKISEFSKISKKSLKSLKVQSSRPAQGETEGGIFKDIEVFKDFKEIFGIFENALPQASQRRERRGCIFKDFKDFKV